MPGTYDSLQAGMCNAVAHQTPSGANLQVAGTSVHGRPLGYASFGDAAASNTTLILAGIHGDETQGAFIAKALIDLFASQPELFAAPGGPLADARVAILPWVNPDGAVAKRRRNAHRVDLNRNFPASNWAPTPRTDGYHGGYEPASEPETRAVLGLVEQFRPNKIIAIHSVSGGVECNNFDGPAEELAALMSTHNHYPVEPHIGYATPGSLGTWAGIERQIPTLTLELPDQRSAQHCWDANREAILAALAYRWRPDQRPSPGDSAAPEV